MDNHTSSKGTSSQVLPVTTVYRFNHPQVALRGCSPFEQPHYFNYSHFLALEDYNEKLPCCHTLGDTAALHYASLCSYATIMLRHNSPRPKA